MNKNILISSLAAMLFAALALFTPATHLRAQGAPGAAVANAKTRTGSVTYFVAPQSKYELDIFSKEAGEPADFAGVEKQCAAAKHPMAFAINGGKCNKSLKPLGLLIKGLVKYKDFVWPDNNIFFPVGPSAVLAIDRDNGLHIFPANKFKVADDLATYRLAIQSGTTLLTRGFMNPVITRAAGTQVCNGIGIRPNGDLVLAVADSKISLREFAVFFEEQGCNDAMMLDDGAACQWYTPGTPKKNGTLGEIIVVTKK